MTDGGRPRRPDAEADLLSTPLWRLGWVRWFVIAAPLGLALAIALSAWVASLEVKQSLNVAVETRWRVGEPLGLRVQVVGEQGERPAEVEVAARVAQGGEAWALGRSPGGALGFVVPADLVVGPASLHLDVRAAEMEELHETLPVEVVEVRPAKVPTPISPSRHLQISDTSDDQPEGLRIVVRPGGRWVAGFDNTLFVRVTDVVGGPWVGPIEVALIDGEFMGKLADRSDPPLLFRGPTDSLGLARLVGSLDTEALRVRVRAGPSDGSAPTWTREVRLVSWPGGVQVDAEPRLAAPGRVVAVGLASLTDKVPIYVEVFGPDGAFADVMVPPSFGREPARPWQVPLGFEGVVQIEAHHHLHPTAESIAFARVQVSTRHEDDAESLAPLLALHRSGQANSGERGYDEDLERRWGDHLATVELEPSQVARAREFLLGTLGPTVYRMPVAAVTGARVAAENEATRRRWHGVLRVYVIGAGAMFLATMALLMVRDHRRGLGRTLADLGEDAMDPEDRAALARQVRRDARGGLVRGTLLLLIMAGGLLLTLFLMENLLG